MSLIISKDIKNPNKPNADGVYVGYKVIRTNNEPYCMPYPAYNIGENISNREDELKKLTKKDLKGKVWEKVAGTNIYKYESLTNVVDYGYHICLTKEDAIRILDYMRINETDKINSVKVIEVFYKEEDIIACGTWILSGEVKCVASNKVTVNSLEGV